MYKCGKLIASGLVLCLMVLVGLAKLFPVQAVVYDSGGSNVWCDASLRTELNTNSNNNFLSYLTAADQAFLVPDACDSLITIPTAAEWTAGAAAYKAAVGTATNYLSGGAASAWTQTAATEGNVYTITGSDGSTTATTAVTSDAPVALPMVTFKEDALCSNNLPADGSLKYPYVLEICNPDYNRTYFDLITSDFCASAIYGRLNTDSNSFLNIFTEEEKSYFVSQVCSGKVALPSVAEWTTIAAETYKSTIDNGTSYLPGDAQYAWTRTAETADSVRTISAQTGSATTVANVKETNLASLPVVYLADNLLVSQSQAGTVADPYRIIPRTYYDAGGDNAWCPSDLNQFLNNSEYGFLADLDSVGGDYLLKTTDWLCGPVGSENTATCSTKVSAVSASEWTAVKETYKTAVAETGSTDYGPPDVENFWTRTPSLAAGEAQAVQTADGSLQSTNVEVYENMSAVPAIYFDEARACVVENVDGGTYTNPFIITGAGCPLSLVVNNRGATWLISAANPLVISGEVTDLADSDPITISATVGGNTQSTTITTPTVGAAWSLTFQFDDMAGAIYTRIPVVATIGSSTTTSYFTDTVIVDHTAPICGPAIDGAATANSQTVAITNAAAANLTDYQIYGNSLQNGTPTPANPVEILNMGTYNSATEKYNIEITTGLAMQTWAGCDDIPIPAGDDSLNHSNIVTLTDARDGKQYRVARFADGNCWMIDNLKYGGDVIDACAGKTSFDGCGNGGTPSNYCGGTGEAPGTGANLYNNWTSNTTGLTSTEKFYGDCRDAGQGPQGGATGYCATNDCGYYYSWQAAMQNPDAWYNNPNFVQPSEPIQGICPAGWILPTNVGSTSFQNLATAAGATATNFWQRDLTTADPQIGFLGLYSGRSGVSGGLFTQGSGGNFWSSTSYSLTRARYLYFNATAADPQYNNVKFNGLAVRCLKDPSLNNGNTNDNAQAQNAGRSYTISLDAPLRCVGTGESQICDYIDYANQQVVRQIGYIASYNGETISSTYMSSTGQLSTGATVQYQLATPTYESVILPAVAVPAGAASVTGLGGNSINASRVSVDYYSSGPAVWTPSAPVPWKTTAATQLFTLSSATDLGGAGITAASYTCTAAAENGASCSATIADNVGNTAQCLSPINRIDVGYPAGGFINYASNSFTNLTTTVAVTVNDGTSLSGINTTTRQLFRRSAPMVAAEGTVSCGTYGNWAATTYTGAYPNLTANAAFVDENCYQYAWSVDNNVGRNTIYTNPNTIQVAEPIVVNITNPSAQLIATADGGLTISGTIGKAKAKTVTVSATIAGAPKSTTISPGNTAWTLQWTLAELTPGTYTGNKTISATDTIVTGTAVYTGTIIVDKDSPMNQSITVIEGTNPEYQYQTGNQIYYNSQYTGGFRVVVVPGVTPSGVKSVAFPSLGAGFTPTTVTTTTASPYAVDYAWTTAATTSPGSRNATTTYGNNLTATSAFVVTRDVTAPVVTLTYNTGYITNLSTQPQMSFTESDSGSGINLASRKLQRASATLANNVCGTYGGFADTTFSVSGGNLTDTAAISDATCYKYQYIIADNVSNSTTVTSSAEFKVDTTAPLTTIASVAVSGGNTYYNAGTKVVYYKTPTSDNTYTVNVDASDVQSGIARVVFPGAAVTGFSPTSAQTLTAAPYSQLYTISTAATSTAPGTQTVTGYNHAELSTNAVYTVTYDDVAPVGNSVTCPSEYSITGNYNITGVVGTDAASGVNTSASYFQVASAALTDNTCGSFGSFANTGSPGAINLQQNPMNNGCYQYRYYTVDNVGNVAISASCTMKVDKVPPTCGITWTPSAPVPWKTVAATQNFVLTGSSDAQTGMTANSYNCTAAAVNGATCNAIIADHAGNTTMCTSPANRIDDQPPQGGYINYESSVQMQLESTISATVADGETSISGVNQTTRQLWRRSAVLNSVNNTCGTYGDWAITTYTGIYPNLVMDEAFTSGTCYQYRWSVASNAGLTAYYTNANEVKVLANAVPGIAFDNPNDTVIATVNGGLTLSGIVADGDNGQTLTIDMTIQNVAKQTQVSTPADNTPWSLNWTWAQLPESQVLTNVSATVFDGIDGRNTAYHPGQVIIDRLAPTITVSPEPQNGDTQQTIVVEATTGASGLGRLAFLWDAPLNSTCTNGRSVLSGTDIGSTQPDGNHTLYLCAISNAGVISTKSVAYGYTPAPLVPILERQVEAKDLYWNALALNPQSDSLTLNGRYDPTGAVYRYNLQLQIRNAQGNIQALKTLNLRTSTTASTDFSFVIPLSELNLSKTNSSFPGPMILTITDLETLQTTTVNWNLGLYVPLYQLDHLVNSGANYIRVYSSQTAQVPTLQNFTQSTCDSWPVVSGSNWSNAYGSSVDNANLAGYYLSDNRTGTLYEVRKFSDGSCWLVDNLSYGGCTTTSWGDATAQAYCRSNPANPAYGHLYNFTAAQSACPSGWRLPSNDQLAALLGRTSDSPAWKDVYAGQVSGAGVLTDQGLQAYYWTQTSATDTLGVALNFAAGQNSQVISSSKAVGLSVMCVK